MILPILILDLLGSAHARPTSAILSAGERHATEPRRRERGDPPVPQNLKRTPLPSAPIARAGGQTPALDYYQLLPSLRLQTYRLLPKTVPSLRSDPHGAVCSLTEAFYQPQIGSGSWELRITVRMRKSRDPPDLPRALDMTLQRVLKLLTFASS
jgi:hypothetical protein